MAVRKILSQFITKARSIHGTRYDYSRVVYILSSVKVQIVCRLHGVFMQSPNTHLAGAGCQECAHITRNRVRIGRARAAFMVRVKTMYGDRYDVSRVYYKDGVHPIEVRCRKHNQWFKTSTEAFARARSRRAVNAIGCCPMCWSEFRTGQIRPFEDFKAELIARYGDRYTIAEKDYRGTTRRLTIKCKLHGDTRVLPRNLLRRNGGCAKCVARDIALARSLQINDSVRKGDLSGLFKTAGKENHGRVALFFKTRQVLNRLKLKEN